MVRKLFCLMGVAFMMGCFVLASNDDLAEAQGIEPQKIVKYIPYEEPIKEVVDEKLIVDTMIIHSCKDYGIDSTIPVAIARYETGHYTSKAFKENNVGGMCIKEVPMKFESLEDGVDAFVRNLSENYFRTGLDTVEKISKKYCPVNAEKWAKTVKQIIKESANA